MAHNLDMNGKEYLASISERLDYHELTQMEDDDERKDKIREEIESDMFDWIERAMEQAFEEYKDKMMEDK